MGIIQTKDLSFVLKNRVLFELQSWTRPAEPTSRPLVPQWPPTHPDHSGEKMIQWDFNLCFLGGGGSICNNNCQCFKGLILKLDMATSIFRSIVIQDCSWILRKSFPLYLFTTMLFNKLQYLVIIVCEFCLIEQALMDEIRHLEGELQQYRVRSIL